MTLLLKISKTKKRLSNDKFIFLHCLTFGLAGLLAVSAYSFRLLTFPRHWTITEFDIPVVKEQNSIKSEDSEILRESTPTVVLTQKAIYYGSLGAFSKKFSERDEKFMVPHRQGHLQLAKLAENVKPWIAGAKIPSSHLAVIIPSSDTSLSSLVELVNFMRNEKIFDTVILGGGIN